MLRIHLGKPDPAGPRERGLPDFSSRFALHSCTFSHQLFRWFAMAGIGGGGETIQAKRLRASVTPRAV